ncbi:MAG: hypothetical protein EZS28_034387, partial [Streblomastix strix]
RCPPFVQIGLLKVVLRLAELGYGLEKLGVLISGLERLKRHKDAQLRNVAENILQILYSQGIIQSPVSTITSKDVIVCELEEQIRRKNEEIRTKEQEKQNLATELWRIKEEKEKVEEQNQKLKIEVDQLKKEKDRHRYAYAKNREHKGSIDRTNIPKFDSDMDLRGSFNSSSFSSSFKSYDLSSMGSTIAIISKDPEDIDFIDIDGYQKRIVKKKDDYDTISLSQVLYDGIWQLETMFQVEEDEDTVHFAAVGIVQDSYNIPADVAHSLQPPYSGGVNHKEQDTYGNTSFKENQSLRLEFDSDKGTLVLYIDDVQQPVYISGIKEKVRFIICMHYVGSSFLIRSLKKLPEPIYVHVDGEKAVDW